ncbi:MAG TPA: NUDIX hydrolase [Ktedonobacterales bacterium]|nr:NUDIX hydrolase [Ktedonobacterales bacterium]
MAEGNPVTPRPAAAVVLARELAGGGIEVFMVRRHVRSEFVPDAFVFPGGSVNPGDIATERAPELCSPVPEGPTALGTGFRVAALRECFEEAGVLIARHGNVTLTIPPEAIERFATYRDELYRQTATMESIAAHEGLILATAELLHWAHWITPDALPKRFDTHFFLAPMPPGQEAAHDRLETTAGVWTTPENALSRFSEGAFPLVFATIHQLRALTGLASVDDAHQRFSAVPVRTIQPRVVQRDGQPVIVLPDEE